MVLLYVQEIEARRLREFALTKPDDVVKEAKDVYPISQYCKKVFAPETLLANPTNR